MKKAILDACVIISYLKGDETTSEYAKLLIDYLIAENYTIYVPAAQKIEVIAFGQKGEDGSAPDHRKSWTAAINDFYDALDAITISLSDSQFVTAERWWETTAVKIADSFFLAAGEYARVDVAYTFDKQVCRIAKAQKMSFEVKDPSEVALQSQLKI